METSIRVIRRDFSVDRHHIKNSGWTGSLIPGILTIKIAGLLQGSKLIELEEIATFQAVHGTSSLVGLHCAAQYRRKRQSTVDPVMIQ